MVWRLLMFAVGVAIGLQGATTLVAAAWPDPAALGGWTVAGHTLHAPWAVLDWRRRLGPEAPPLFAAATALILAGAGVGLGAGLIAESLLGAARRSRRRGWGGLAEARAAGLRAASGCVLGELRGRLLITADLRPTLVTGGTRSGKGRGHVVPSLLCWPDSVLVHDPKGELWRVTAGWRAGFSHVLRFAPRDLAAARWNPLAEIRPGPGALAAVQRLVAILADPAGGREDEAIWDRSASEILEAVILHVLYAAPDGAKTLLTVRELVADLDATAEVMLRTLHEAVPGGAPRTHPFVRIAVTGYAAMHDRFRTSVQGTARSYLKWLAGEDVERALSASDFALGDLMCADAPVSLYVQVAPADAVALRPLARLLFYAAAQALTAHEDADAAGRPKRRRLLMVMDEFPLLGRLEFFEKSLRLMSGYGIKPLLVAQSLNDIVETYQARAVSPAGAAGLTQLMPATAAALGVRDRFDPAENLAGGAAYLAQQLRRFGDVRLALAAYNAGPARVARLGRVPELVETRAYVAAVVDRFLALAAGRAVGGPFGRRPARPPAEPDHGPLD